MAIASGYEVKKDDSFRTDRSVPGILDWQETFSTGYLCSLTRSLFWCIPRQQQLSSRYFCLRNRVTLGVSQENQVLWVYFCNILMYFAYRITCPKPRNKLRRPIERDWHLVKSTQCLWWSRNNNIFLCYNRLTPNDIF